MDVDTSDLVTSDDCLHRGPWSSTVFEESVKVVDFRHCERILKSLADLNRTSYIGVFFNQYWLRNVFGRVLVLRNFCLPSP